MDKILIPMIALCDIEESIPAMGIGCKKGDIFWFDPDNQVHQVLKDHNSFVELENDKCDFICNFQPRLEIGNKEYEFGEKINIKNLCDIVLTNLTYIGYIKKVLKTEDKKEIKTKTIPSITYTKLAKELGCKTPDFKKKVQEGLGYIIADMRKNVPATKVRKIKQLFKKNKKSEQ